MSDVSYYTKEGLKKLKDELNQLKGTDGTCPPCPACERCPEPSFECKKVPNYSAVNSSYLPIPVLNDFSTFGM